MKVLVGCERTRTVASAFEREGHYAMSCDLKEQSAPGPHYRGDIMALLEYCIWHKIRWDLIILHPDCTKMALCGNGTYAPGGNKTTEREQSEYWTSELWNKAKTAGDRVCLENPKSTIFPILREVHGAHVQYIQPNQFGHPETKETGLALHNLNPLVPTWDVEKIMMSLPKKERHKIWYMSPSEDRGDLRSVFFPGVGRAMAEQWGSAVQTGLDSNEN